MGDAERPAKEPVRKGSGSDAALASNAHMLKGRLTRSRSEALLLPLEKGARDGRKAKGNAKLGIALFLGIDTKMNKGKALLMRGTRSKTPPPPKQAPVPADQEPAMSLAGALGTGEPPPPLGLPIAPVPATIRVAGSGSKSATFVVARSIGSETPQSQWPKEPMSPPPPPGFSFHSQRPNTAGSHSRATNKPGEFSPRPDQYLRDGNPPAANGCGRRPSALGPSRIHWPGQSPPSTPPRGQSQSPAGAVEPAAMSLAGALGLGGGGAPAQAQALENERRAVVQL